MAASGLNTRVPFFDATDGTMLSGFVEGDTMYGERFERDSESPARVALALQQVHRLGPVSKSRFDIFSMIESRHRAPSLLPAPRQRGA